MNFFFTDKEHRLVYFSFEKPKHDIEAREQEKIYRQCVADLRQIQINKDIYFDRMTENGEPDLGVHQDIVQSEQRVIADLRRSFHLEIEEKNGIGLNREEAIVIKHHIVVDGKKEVLEIITIFPDLRVQKERPKDEEKSKKGKEEGI